jgi:hypothetical protein
VTSRPSGWRPLLATGAAALVFAVATPWLLRPWFLTRDRVPHSELPLYGMMEDADLYLNVWILAWTAHAALTHPAAMFDGNVYHPARNTIAGSENMLAHLPVTMPTLAATGDAIAVLKATCAESVVLTGLAMALFVGHHTHSAVAALVAGAAFTLAPWRVHMVPHPQYLAIQYLVLALLGVDVWVDTGRRRGLVLLATAIALQFLACLYLGYFAAITVPVYAAARLAAPGRSRASRAMPLLAALAVGALAVVPVAWPYLRARAAGMITTFNLGDAASWSWPPWWYLGAGFVGDVGAVTVAIVVADVVARVVLRRRRPPSTADSPERALWVVAVTGVVLSAGPYLELPGGHRLPMPYLLAYHLVPGFSAVRAPRRFFMVVATAMAALAGLAVARWTARLSRGSRVAIGVLGVIACAVVAAPRPAATEVFPLGSDAAPVYQWLARQPAGAVLELPATVSDNDIVGNLRNARYMVASTVHWHPIVNGLTGHAPLSAPLLTAIARRLPDEEALGVLVDAVDVRWIVLHRDALDAEGRARWPEQDAPGLATVAHFDSDQVFAVERRPTHGWRDAVIAAAPSAMTLGGVSTAPLAPACRGARIVDVVPPPVIALAPITVPIRVRFENLSDCAWPALGVRADGLVVLTYQWIDPNGVRGNPPRFLSRLIHDVPPHATVDETMIVVPEGTEAGTWQLEVIVQQVGEPEPLAHATVPVRLQAFAR